MKLTRVLGATALAVASIGFGGGIAPAGAIEIDLRALLGCTIIVDGPGAVFGTDGDDVICGDDGNNVIYAKGGNDIVLTFGGNDLVFLGDSADCEVEEQPEPRIGHKLPCGDFAVLGAGNDRGYGGNGTDFMLGGLGDDQLWGQNGDDVLAGSSLAQLFFLPWGPLDYLGPVELSEFDFDAALGNDRVYGGNDDDVCQGAVTQTCETVIDVQPWVDAN